MSYSDDFRRDAGEKWGLVHNKDSVENVADVISYLKSALPVKDPLIGSFKEYQNNNNGINNITVNKILEIISAQGIELIEPDLTKYQDSEIDLMPPLTREDLEKFGIDPSEINEITNPDNDETPATPEESGSVDGLEALDESMKGELDSSEINPDTDNNESHGAITTPEDPEALGATEPLDPLAESMKDEFKKETKTSEQDPLVDNPEDEKSEFDYLIEDIENDVEKQKKDIKDREKNILTRGNKLLHDIENIDDTRSEKVGILDMAAYLLSGSKGKNSQIKDAKGNIKSELIALHSDNGKTEKVKNLIRNNLIQVQESSKSISEKLDLLSIEKDTKKKVLLKAEIKTLLNPSLIATLKDVAKHAKDGDLSPGFREELKHTLGAFKDTTKKMSKSDDSEMKKMAEEAIKSLLEALRSFGKTFKKVVSSDKQDSAPEGP